MDCQLRKVNLRFNSNNKYIPWKYFIPLKFYPNSIL